MGWATTPTSTTVTYKDKANVTNIAIANGTINLYAVWEKINGYFWIMLRDGYTYSYDKNGNLLSKTATNGQFTIPATGSYTLELHGGGGCGGYGKEVEHSSVTCSTYSLTGGAGGGGSGNIETVVLQKNEVFNVKIGIGCYYTSYFESYQGWIYTYHDSANDKQTSFSNTSTTYSVEGGASATGTTPGAGSGNIASSGKAASTVSSKSDSRICNGNPNQSDDGIGGSGGLSSFASRYSNISLVAYTHTIHYYTNTNWIKSTTNRYYGDGGFGGVTFHEITNGTNGHARTNGATGADGAIILIYNGE